MAKPEWGKKHICSSCGAPFYDLKRKTFVCPSCGEELRTASSKSRGGTAGTKPVSEETAAVAAVDSKAAAADEELEIASDDELSEDEEIEEAEDEDDDDVLGEDSSLIGEDGEGSLEALGDSEPA